jgi:uncharacterized membrane protein
MMAVVVVASEVIQQISHLSTSCIFMMLSLFLVKHVFSPSRYGMEDPATDSLLFLGCVGILRKLRKIFGKGNHPFSKILINRI